MKRIMQRAAKSSFALAVLVAAMLQAAGPARTWAQEDEEECTGSYALCSIEEERTCRFWIFFCKTETTNVYYSDLYN